LSRESREPRARAQRDRSGGARRGRRVGGIVAFVSGLWISIGSPAHADAPAPDAGAADDPYPKAAASYLVTVNGALLWAHAPDRALPPASLTKIMTGLLLAEDAPADDASAERPSDRSQARPDARFAELPIEKSEEVVVVGREAAAATGSRLGLREGERLRRADLFDALLVGSANDACLALAAHASGSIDRFVLRMNERARQLALRGTVFRNPCGLDAEGHVSTARDLLVLAKLAMQQPAFARAVAKREVAFHTLTGRPLRKASGNLLLGRVPGTVGVKSGFTNRAGKCLVAMVRRGEDEVVVVLLNAPDRWWSASILIDDAFAALDAARR
jgi:D-alanyl-D-alanine carboxypeptidase (penicillin-binding protein 5/6)